LPARSEESFADAPEKSLVMLAKALEPSFAAAMLASRAFSPACSAAVPRRRAARVVAGIASSTSSSLVAGASPEGVGSALVAESSLSAERVSSSPRGSSSRSAFSPFARASSVTAPASMNSDAGFACSPPRSSTLGSGVTSTPS
jgi:hypothetical protein